MRGIPRAVMHIAGMRTSCRPASMAICRARVGVSRRGGGDAHLEIRMKR